MYPENDLPIPRTPHKKCINSYTGNRVKPKNQHRKGKPRRVGVEQSLAQSIYRISSRNERA
jgi:hypothetical protein